MQTKFLVNGNNVRVYKFSDDQLVDTLTPKIYEVSFDPLMGYSLVDLKERLTLPSKIYGKASERADKCIRTYKDRPNSTGILLTGDKGTGKTLLTSILANKVINELNLPVIIVSEAHSGAAFTSFISDIGECCIIFDEFGKMYESNIRRKNDDTVTQDSMLALLDGVDKTKRLILLTENSERDINEFILNRPSRVYYHFRYGKLDGDSVRDYCADFNIPEAVVTEILEVVGHVEVFGFDILKTLIEEYLRYGESIDATLKDLNVDLTSDNKISMQVMNIVNRSTGEKYEIQGSPILSDNFGEYRVSIKDASEEDDCKDIYFGDSHVVFSKDDFIIFEISQYRITVKKIINGRINYSMLL